ncbi:WcaF family extracellular polysaccharide biosynthesis acetyltransferase [Fodinibius sp. AD559]|uniref:WcaF family extracellular polysaccharide biosynthesis acetyltransferase n=1 Tax=Fodinibius sp. AD559 TaxID=3424179 RepID=UPI004046DF37
MNKLNKTDLSQFNNDWYSPGRGVIVRSLWYVINVLFLKNSFSVLSILKVKLLRLFGATIGKNVVIKPNVNIKYPWNLNIGDNSWIGEEVWIDNLADVHIGKNVCISQGAMLLTGNHNYTKQSFDLITEPIIIEEGVWIGAQSVVCPGVECKSHSILSVGSVATGNLESYTIYQGVPAKEKRNRIIE